MNVDQGPVVTHAECQICDERIPLDEVDVIHQVVAHTACFPSHWVESRDEMVEATTRRAA